MIVRELLTRLGYQVDESGIKKAEDKLSGLKKLAAGLALGAGLYKLGEAAISTASDMENLNTNFEVLLGSAEKAKGFSDFLVDFAAKTPYALGALGDVAKGLISYDIPLQDTKKYLGQLGDIALGSEDKMKSLGIVLGQVASNGKLQGQDLLQFINAGFNPLSEMAKLSWKSMASLRKDMEKGNFTFDMVRQTMEVATSKGGRFFQGMAKGAGTLSGMWRTVKDTMNLGLASIAKAFFPLMKKVMDVLSKIDFSALAAIGESVAAGFERMGQAFIQSGALQAFADLKEALATAANTAIFASGAIGEGGDIWASIGLLVGKFAEAVMYAASFLVTLSNIFIFLGGLLGPFASLLQPIAVTLGIIFGVQMIGSILAFTATIGGATTGMWLLNGATAATALASARTTLAFIAEALALGQVSVAAGIAKMALVSMAASPLVAFIALGAVLALLLQMMNQFNEAQQATIDNAQEAEFQRQQGVWGDKRKKLAEDKQLLKSMKEQGWKDDNAQVQAVKDRIKNEETLLKVQSGAMDKMMAERNKKQGNNPADFQASVEASQSNAQTTMAKMVDSNTKNNNVKINTQVAVTVPAGPEGQTPLTAGAVKDIATRAADAVFSLQLQKVLISTL